MSTKELSSLLEHIQQSVRNDAHRLQFKELVRTAIKTQHARTVIEIGAGRKPLFSTAEISELGVDYTANDISQSELDQCSPGISTSCFDIAAQDQPVGAYDFLFSSMVLEHVAAGELAHRNSAGVLNEGGIAIHRFPTLYCLPYVANWLFPEALSNRVHAMVDRRDRKTQPKFPAHYDMCTSSIRNQRKIESTGFRHVELIPLWGHGYYRQCPRLESLNVRVQEFARDHTLRWTSSYALAVCLK